MNFDEAYSLCKPFSMLQKPRLKAIWDGVQTDALGAVVQCGVWRGGSVMMALYSMMEMPDTDWRIVHCLDTFTGMVEPTAEDKEYYGRGYTDYGESVSSFVNTANNINTTGYPRNLIFYHAGDVMDTAYSVRDPVAFLFLDTDWYASIKAGLKRFLPMMSAGGIVLVDDYYTFSGARQAVDEEVSLEKYSMTQIEEAVLICSK
jgi:hypothetical protein